MTIDQFEIILYVSDQARSRDFYSLIFQKAPELDVPGMTEFVLANNLKLGLMPESGIANILMEKTPDPASGNGIPRCELYLRTDHIEESFELAKKAGATEISGIEQRDWGDRVCYFADFDGHIIAFASSDDLCRKLLN